jgi:hypothetical protein
VGRRNSQAQPVPGQLMRRAMKSTPSAEKRVLFVAGLSIPASIPKTRATAAGGGKKGRYKSLAKEFRRNGFTYRQIAREGDAAIYEQKWSGSSQPNVCYEVICIRHRGRVEIAGKFIEPHESYPKAKAWGLDGFTLTDKDAALVKLRELKKFAASHRQ